MDKTNVDYDNLSKDYSKTHEKPDKKYSMLPTMLKLLNLDKNKIVIDVGCGDGFFTKPIAELSKKVYGIDNSKKQIKKAKKNSLPNINYSLTNMFNFNYPSCDRISCPFILNLVKTKKDLVSLFKKFYSSLSIGGKIIGIIDMPKSLVHDSKEWGAIKRIQGNSLKEGAVIDIELYNKGKHIITLHSYYHEKKVIEQSLLKADFNKITWHKPIISKEGISKMGKDFWKRYLKKCDVAYFSAVKTK